MPSFFHVYFLIIFRSIQTQKPLTLLLKGCILFTLVNNKYTVVLTKLEIIDTYTLVITN